MRLVSRRKILVTIGVLLTIGALVLVGMEKLRTHMMRTDCYLNLDSIGNAMAIYMRENNGVMPPNLMAMTIAPNDTLIPEAFSCGVDTLSLFGSFPADQVRADVTSGRRVWYIYVGDGFTPSSPGLDSKLDADVVLIFEPLANHKGKDMNVLFADQHCEFVSGERAKSILDQYAAGIRPIRLKPQAESEWKLE